MEDRDKNTDKITGGTTGKGFDVLGQPSSEAKRIGWQRRQQAQAIMDAVLKYMDMPVEEIERITKKKPKDMTARDRLAFEYVAKSFEDSKLLTDLMDRHVPKAPQDIDIKSNGQPIKIVLGNDSNRDSET